MSDPGKSISDVFKEGQDAALFGLPRKKNPYPSDSEENEAWFEGWDVARADAGDPEVEDN